MYIPRNDEQHPDIPQLPGPLSVFQIPTSSPSWASTQDHMQEQSLSIPLPLGVGRVLMLILRHITSLWSVAHELRTYKICRNSTNETGFATFGGTDAQASTDGRIDIGDR